jgi:ABC-type transport system involved in multi-copper enzyme maturation permease subunit
MTLLLVELRRGLTRRLVQVLIGLALVATGIVGVVTYVQSSGPSGDAPISLVDLWPTSGKDPILLVPAVFLAAGALLAGASVVGAEWRAGSISTLVTWEPRRGRVAVAKIATAALAAAAIGLILQVVFVLALLPALLVHGSTAGADAEWFWGMAGGIARSAVLTGLAAAVGASLAMVGRNTAVAFGAAFVYLNVVEGALRAWKPWAGRWLISENVAVFLLGGRVEDMPFTRAPLTATMTIAVYVAVVAAVATTSFRRRDIAT